MTKRVRALALGFDNLCLREPGDEFDMPDSAKGPWFEDVGKGRRFASLVDQKAEEKEDAQG